MNHDDLVNVAVKWLSKPWRNAGDGGHGSCSVIISEMTSSSRETPDAIGFHGGFSTLIECKASRADFRNDAKKYFRIKSEAGMGFYRYMMVPAGLISLGDLPSGWGLIEVSPEGRTRVKAQSSAFEENHRNEKHILLSLICRLKVEHSDHVKVRVYSMDDGKTPRATAHLKSTATAGEKVD